MTQLQTHFVSFKFKNRKHLIEDPIDDNMIKKFIVKESEASNLFKTARIDQHNRFCVSSWHGDSEAVNFDAYKQEFAT